jgi:hypothetical protein
LSDLKEYEKTAEEKEKTTSRKRKTQNENCGL